MQGKETRNELILGIALCCVGLGIAGMLLGGGATFLAGLLVGMATAIGISFHMYRCIDVTLDLDEESAKRFGRNKSMLRALFMSVAIVASFMLHPYMHPLGTVLGIWTLKLSAYIHPFIHKFITPKIFRKGEVDKE